jgi:hypothetical protein
MNNDLEDLQAEYERLLTLVCRTFDPDKRRLLQHLLDEVRRRRDALDPPDPDPWLSLYFDA